MPPPNCTRGTSGGTVAFDLIAGSNHAGADYFLLASASGTAPGLALGTTMLPLNLDPLLLFCLQNPNSPMLDRTFGTLDGLGRAAAWLHLPPGLLSFALRTDFAFAILDHGSIQVRSASNPVPVQILP